MPYHWVLTAGPHWFTLPSQLTCKIAAPRMGVPPSRPRLVRIKRDQVFCRIPGCDRAASFVLYQPLGGTKPAVMAYCEEHVQPIAEELGLRLPPNEPDRE